ncbi:MAG: LutC/YkgG family protein [Sphingobacterium sp.]
MNIRNTTAKEKMLKKIRQALLQKKENPHPAFEDRPLYGDQEDALDLVFANEFTQLGGQFLYCDGEIDLIENLIILVEKIKVSKIYVWEKALQEILDPYGFPFRKSIQEFEEIDASITSCEALIARNGSILLSNASESGRRLSVYAPVHIVIAKASQLVLDIKDGLDLVRERYEPNLPTMISTVSGPSRTADIEKRLVLGAHGPKELYLFLLEDRF